MAIPYLKPADLRGMPGMANDDGETSSARLERLIATFEGVAEEYRGVAFTPRVAEEKVTLWLRSRSLLQLAWPKVRSVTSVTVDGTVIDADTYLLTEVGEVYAATPLYGQQVVVVYEHGYDPPHLLSWPGAPMLLEACRTYVRSKAKQAGSGVSRDAISIAGPDGGTTRYSTPNAAEGRPTGYLEVDELLNLLPNYVTPGIG